MRPGGDDPAAASPVAAVDGDTKRKGNERGAPPLQRRLDLAARVAWLYYVRGRTQDEIARQLNLSRQNVQRLVAVANSEGLIKFRLDHPLSECIALAQRLQDAFELRYCEVAPSEREDDDNRLSLGIYAARYIENLMTQKVPVTLGIGTGRTLRAAAAQVPSMDQPQHRIVSLVGNVGSDGRATPYDVVMRLADRVGAQCYPLPMPILANSREEREMLQSQRGYQAISRLAAEAKAWVVGIGDIGWNAPLHVDGFIDDAELGTLMEQGAIGEVLGWTFNAEGRMVLTEIHERLTAVRHQPQPPRTVLAVGGGASKIAAIHAALKGHVVNALITDETTAREVMEL
jgi:DNA-binding transcriptional regulator LsrR (DeoR family)